MQQLGDFEEDYATLNFYFSTHKGDGTPATLSDTPAVSVYKGSSTTQSTAGITLNVDFDGVTGLNHVLIDLSADAFYAIANDYAVVITTGTVDSISVVGMVVALFSIENRFADAKKINGSASAAARMALSAGQIIPGTVDSTAFAMTTTEFECDDITEATADHYKGRAIIFTSGALTGQACAIKAYSLVGGRGHLTVSTLTEAPANDDTFVII